MASCEASPLGGTTATLERPSAPTGATSGAAVANAARFVDAQRLSCTCNKDPESKPVVLRRGFVATVQFGKR